MKDSLKGKKILITAGPTREYLDPVRFITNESSGKMGYAIAEALHAKGADVRLVSGPVSIKPTFPEAKIHRAVSSLEMYEISKHFFHEVDIAIFSAAVADYRPKAQSKCKIKKAGNTMQLEFIKNLDIARKFGQEKSADQISVSFGYDTNRVSIMCCDSTVYHYPLKSKKEVALDIIDQLDGLIFRKSRHERVFLNKF
jgi:phosphopantothenoylcysteine decarboxylase/phosphopantothenate--cysteine ligase